MASILLLTYLSLVPGTLRPHTGAPGNLEHAMAYAGTSALIVLAWPHLRKLIVVSALSVAAAGFEIMQIWVPGRSSQVMNWAFSTIGAVIGTLAAVALAYALARRHGKANKDFR